MKTKFFIYSLFLLAIVLLFFSAWRKIDYFKSNDAIHIAFVGPLTGKDADQGTSMRQALKVLVDSFNEHSIIQSKIILDSFDDKNNPSMAAEVAKDIVESEAVAVIGHRRSDCSIAAGKIYKKSGIPAITPTSSVIKVTADNEWYFRTFFDNDLQGRLLATYAKRFLLSPNKNTISIIYLDTPYGNELAEIFGQTSQKMEVEVKYQWKLTNQGPKQKQQIAQIVSELQTKSDDAGLIFLATQRHEGVQLVKSIKDAGIKNPLIAPDSYANFHESFKNYPKEKKTPGYYTEGIYVTAFLLDIANQEAQELNSMYQKKYQTDLPNAAFYALDAAIAIILAIMQIEDQKQQELNTFRKKLRDTIASFNTPETATVIGFTGPNYFDEHGNISKPISMGIYRENRLISAPLQLISPDENDQRHKTVVYTGVQFNDFSDINLNNFTYKPDFYLWFRFKPEHDGPVIKPQDIRFTNAVTSSIKKEPTNLGITNSLIELKQPIIEETIDGQTYLLYRINDISFKEERKISDSAFIAEHMLGISFRHKQLDKDKLIYVHDVLGTKREKKEPLLDNTSEVEKPISLANWEVAYKSSFPSIIKEKPLGNPKYLGENAIEYSTFNAGVVIKSNAYAYHRFIPYLIPHDYSHPSAIKFFILFISVVTLLLIIVSYTQNNYLKLLWFVQAIFAFLLLISVEVYMRDIRIDTETIRAVIITTFNILWWLIPAILLDIAIRRFLWMPLEEKTGHSIPVLIRFLVSFIIYCLALFGIIAFVFEQLTASFFATGSLLAAIFGFAQLFQLPNLFSGIALSLERSFRVGDWVKIGDFEDGKVVDVNWRTTKIQTGNDYIISIPNTVVSASDIRNFSYPDNQYWLQFNILLDPKDDPRMIEDIIIRAIFSVEEHIVKDAKPYILLEDTKGKIINNLVANYAVFFKTENYQHKSTVLRNVWQHIWVHLTQAGVIVPSELHDKDVPKKPVAFTSSQLPVLTKDNLRNMITGAV